jgi:large subunit ribosomal protein L1
MRKRSKRYKECLAQMPEGKVPLEEAVKLIGGFASNKFDATVELVMHLGIDPKQADQALRGALSLPHGIGSTKKVIAFCEEGDEEAAKAAGATEVGKDELVKKIMDGWMDFDVAVASPKVMRDISKLGRVLGPQGKMPSPKAGTVGPDIAQMVTEYSAGKVEYRNDDGGNLHVPVGKASFEAEKLVENISTFLSLIRSMRPNTTKGTYIKKVSVSTTMSPGIELDV